jgi:hypothetical protein
MSTLLSLPRELRDMIYEYVIGDEQPAGNFGLRDSRSGREKPRNILHSSKLSALLCVNHQLRDEFSIVIYRGSHFTFHIDLKIRWEEAVWHVSQNLINNIQQCSIKGELVEYGNGMSAE